MQVYTVNTLTQHHLMGLVLLTIDRDFQFSAVIHTASSQLITGTRTLFSNKTNLSNKISQKMKDITGFVFCVLSYIYDLYESFNI